MRDIKEYFVRPIPDDSVYVDRINKEIEIASNLNAVEFFIEVSRICAATKGIPKTIRGSAGSSLLAWALGINDLDPVKWNIPVERFMNGLRKDLPDIDLDFAHDEREKVFEVLDSMYPGSIGRVVNHVSYKDKSAVREALRVVGYRKKIPADFIVSDLVPGDENTVFEIASELKGTVKSLDLHCGGAILFKDGVPNGLKINGTKNHIRYDKREVEREKLWKLDVLSNRALSQLRDCGINSPDEIDPEDPNVADLLSRGDSFGLTQAESPAFKKILRAIRPKSVRELALCMGLVRPAAAWRGHRALFVENWTSSRESRHLVFEDDANSVISTLAGVSLEEADSIRRAFSKQDFAGIQRFSKRLQSKPETAAILNDLASFKEFSMCESHAVAYAKITWALAYAKCTDPRNFWHSTLNNAISMYRPWVHIREAILSGLDVKIGKKPWLRDADVLYNPGYTEPLFPEDKEFQFRKHGYWTGREFLYGCRESVVDDSGKLSIRGVIAIYRIVKMGTYPTTFVTVSTSNGRYVDISIPGAYDLSKSHFIECEGEITEKFGSEWIEADHVS